MTTHCQRCGGALAGRLNRRRRWCGKRCRHKATYLRAQQRKGQTPVMKVPQGPVEETKRERYLRQCAETAWI